MNDNLNEKGDFDGVPVTLVPKSGPMYDRICDIKMFFIKCFQEEPEFYVRVPGRVNLIGEHIDYCGYAVCPMAIKQDILLAARTVEDGILKLVTPEPDKYPDFETKICSFRIQLEDGAPKWHNYFLCGLKGVLEEGTGVSDLQGLQVVVTGTIPPRSGLSSSSALVSAAALCSAHAFQVHLSRRELASLAARSERYIGTQGGGMDQAIAFLGSPGHAKLIEFNPLRDTDVQLPKNAAFVIAHSLIEMNKAATADFNSRVVDCRLAALLLSKLTGMLNWQSITKLADLQSALGQSLEQMADLVKSKLHIQTYSKTELCDLLGVTVEKLEDLALSYNTQHLQDFHLHQRALHVFQEAWRVRQFCAACERGAEMKELGRLMSASHISLRDLYEASHPEVDRLVSIAPELIHGARLTGAGWGGCTVALTDVTKAHEHIAAIKNQFYSGNPAVQGRDFDQLIFQSEPQGGASVLIPAHN